MSATNGRCAFCCAAGGLVPTAVLDEKWSRRFGGDPVLALDHGWYHTPLGQRVAADHGTTGKFFGAHVRVLCDYCAHGWVEDVRWRAEPTVLDLATGRPSTSRLDDGAALARWSCMTAMLAELVSGVPTASSTAQRDAVRRGAVPVPRSTSWFFRMRQRLPARVHLSQVRIGSRLDGGSLVQIVTVDVAHFSTLVVLPSDDEALAVVDRSGVEAEFGRHADVRADVTPLDLARTPPPHRVAVQRICAASYATVC